MLAFIGMVVVAMNIGVGAWYVLTRITFREEKQTYEYRVDEQGNDVVVPLQKETDK